MPSKSKTITFFGSGPVAAASLKELKKDFSIELVITKPATVDEMKAITTGTDVKAVANKKELDELIKGKRLMSRVGVIVDFGIIVSRAVIDKFPMGIVNSHFSLLPRWRGADPIAFAILHGDKSTGVSLMLVNEKLDEGHIIAQEEIKLLSSETTPELTGKLIKLSNKMLAEYLPKYMAGRIKPWPQDLSIEVSYSHKLAKSDGLIDWSKPAGQIEREIRAYRDWPKSRTRLGQLDLIILKSRAVKMPGQGDPGKIKIIKNQLFIETGRDWLELLGVQPAGKKPMDIPAFLAGYRSRLL